MTDGFFNSLVQGYRFGNAVRQEHEARRQQEEIQNVFKNVMTDPQYKDNPDRALREAANRFGESGNVNGYNMVLNQAAQLQKQKAAFQQQLGNVASFVLFGGEAKDRDKRLDTAVGMAKELGIPLPDTSKMSEDQKQQWLSGFIRPDDLTKLLMERMKGVSGVEKEKTKGEAGVKKTIVSKTYAGGGMPERYIQLATWFQKNVKDEAGKPLSAELAMNRAKDIINKTKDRNEFIKQLFLSSKGFMTRKKAESLADTVFGGDAAPKLGEGDFLNLLGNK